MSKELDPFEKSMLDPRRLGREVMRYYDFACDDLTNMDPATAKAYEDSLLNADSLAREIAAHHPRLDETIDLSFEDDVFPELPLPRDTESGQE
jgi:hypothetical protein